MNSQDIINFLKEVALFKELNFNELELIASKMKVLNLDEKQILFEENQQRESLFIIYKGSIELFKKTQFGKIKILRIFEKTDFLSEGALLDTYPHSTFSRAMQPTTVLALHRDSFNALSSDNYQTVLKILSEVARTISRRMRVTTSMIVGAAAQYASGKTRLEHDLLGERDVPFEHYYGIQTLRALENFNISGIPLFHFPNLLIALAQVKLASAKANNQLGLLDDKVTDAIVQASREIINGKYHTHFVVDLIQGGAGTSTNMNANEIIANRALELMGHQKGEYQFCHPNTHVNMSQSTNDVYPTSLRLALIYQNKELLVVLKELVQSFLTKSEEFASVIKMGRTQLQDAVPMTLGQEFEAYSVTLAEEIERLEENVRLFLEVNMGGTAIGTGINADPRYSDLCVKELCEATDLPLKLATNLVEATQDTGAFIMYSSAVKRLAVKLSKICNDLRLLSSGPRTGFGEINLPPMQPGSSIMPGKVNPVIPEVVNQIAYKVIGNDLTVTLAAEAGQLQLNVMEPIIAQSLFESTEMLKNGMATLKYRCIDGITANADRCLELVQKSIGVVTALNPALGYEKCTQLAKEALLTNKGVYELVLEHNLMTKEELDEILAPENMIKPQNIAKK